MDVEVKHSSVDRCLEHVVDISRSNIAREKLGLIMRGMRCRDLNGGLVVVSWNVSLVACGWRDPGDSLLS